MDPMASRSGDLLPSVSLDPRLNGCKAHHDIIHAQDSGDTHEILNAQYINLHRLSDNLPKVQLDSLSSDLLGHHVVDLPSSSSIVSPNGTANYYGEDLLANDLTEEDKRLAAALMAVQFAHQQKSNSLLTTDLLNTKTMAPLSPFNTASVEKPGMAAMVTSYIQAFEDEAAAQHLLESSNPVPQRKAFSPQPQTIPDIRLPPLPPLKKVISTQNHVRSKSKKMYNEHLSDHNPIKDCVNESSKMSKADDLDTSIEEPSMEDMDSDYEVDSDLKPSRRSLPHKKRIPRKLKTQPQRSIHSKCYKCQKCGDTFSNQSTFFSHRSQHVNPPKRSSTFSCEICLHQSINQMQFFEHLKTHYEAKNAVESVIQTDLPEFNDGTERGIDAFTLKPGTSCRARKDMPDSAVTCEHCGKVFSRKRAYEAHLALVHSPPIEEFSEPEDMMEGIRHVVNIQTGCPDEDNDDKQLRGWKDLHSIQSSVRTSTPEKVLGQSDKFDVSPPDNISGKKKTKRKELACPHCPKIFLHRTSYVYHIRSHTGKRAHQCEVCGKSFFASTALKVHSRMHSGDKPFKCEACGRCFRQYGDLKYHEASLHSTQKQYQCEFCGKDFARRYSLIVHRRIHTNEKNYVCEFCCKSFRASSYLVNHRRIHTGEKPHTCEICSKSFRVKSDLKRHSRIHYKTIRPAPSASMVLHDQDSTTSGQPLVDEDHSLEQSSEFLISPHVTASASECILPDVQAPLNLMRSDGLAYTRDSLSLERDHNTLYVLLRSGPDSILPD